MKCLRGGCRGTALDGSNFCRDHQPHTATGFANKEDAGRGGSVPGYRDSNDRAGTKERNDRTKPADLENRW